MMKDQKKADQKGEVKGQGQERGFEYTINQ